MFVLFKVDRMDFCQYAGTYLSVGVTTLSATRLETSFPIPCNQSVKSCGFYFQNLCSVWFLLSVFTALGQILVNSCLDYK